jgi:hypothetical protein
MVDLELVWGGDLFVYHPAFWFLPECQREGFFS